MLTAAEQIYDAYPRKVGKRDAIKKIQRALREVPFAELLDKTKQFAATVNGHDRKYIPYPGTWFHQARYDDDPTEWQAQYRGNQFPTWEQAWDTVQRAIEHWDRYDREKCVEANKMLHPVVHRLWCNLGGFGAWADGTTAQNAMMRQQFKSAWENLAERSRIENNPICIGNLEPKRLDATEPQG